jgi:hypothetical protein
MPREDESLMPPPRESPERERPERESRRGPPVRPEEYAARYQTGDRCEREARRLLALSRDDAWTALKSCVEGTRFTQLASLLGEAWIPELQSRPEGPRLIAQVVAQRGGSVEGEFKLLHERKVPIFALASAMAQPDAFQGRYVLLRAQVADVRTDGGRPTFWLVEQRLGSELSEHQGPSSPPDEFSPGPSRPRGGRGGGAQRSFSSGTRYDNISNETGREALGRMARTDPFFAPGREFIVLARFDGMRATSGGDDDEEGSGLPVLSIISYHIPHPLVVY